MNILWLTWKDTGHPEAGGAELVASELCSHLLADGNNVTMLTCGYKGAARKDKLNGIQVIRVGSSRYLHPFQASWYYLRHLRNRYDVVIEEVQGCAPYYASYFGKRSKRFVLFHQLARVNWLYEVPKPFAYVGYYLLAPAAVRLLSFAHAPLITVSESTQEVLSHYGFHPEQSHIISEGITIDPIEDLESVKKFSKPTILSLGAMRAMKRTLDHITAFEIAKTKLPDLQLKLAGKANSKYGQRVLERTRTSPFRHDIEFLGMVSKPDKIKLMQQAHLTLQTAVEEGWGLTVTEAASQGTPAVVYDVPGLRDSVRHNKTGIITKPTPPALAKAIVGLLTDQSKYERLRYNGWQWSKQITFDQSYTDFKQILETA